MTNKQKQHLLAYLGYYAGEIDGSFGPKSVAATKAFQRVSGMPPDGVFGSKTEARILEAVAKGEMAKADTSTSSGTFWDDIKYFKRAEFACKCGKCGGFPAEPKEKLIRNADKVRDHFGRPMTVSSGVRCAAHNTKVGGVSNSRHLSGKAMDFCVSGFSASSVLPYVQSLSGIRYAYAIDGNFVHMDIE